MCVVMYVIAYQSFRLSSNKKAKVSQTWKNTDLQVNKWTTLIWLLLANFLHLHEVQKYKPFLQKCILGWFKRFLTLVTVAQ